MSLKFISPFMRRAAGYRLGRFLLVLHLALAVCAISRKAPPNDHYSLGHCSVIPVAGRAIQIPSESPRLKTIALPDLPSIFVGYLFMLFLSLLADIFTLSISIDAHVLITTVSLLILTSIQWWAVGFVIESLILLKKRATLR
jgi:hypothetical protein